MEKTRACQLACALAVHLRTYITLLPFCNMIFCHHTAAKELKTGDGQAQAARAQVCASVSFPLPLLQAAFSSQSAHAWT